MDKDAKFVNKDNLINAILSLENANNTLLDFAEIKDKIAETIDKINNYYDDYENFKINTTVSLNEQNELYNALLQSLEKEKDVRTSSLYEKQEKEITDLKEKCNNENNELVAKIINLNQEKDSLQRSSEKERSYIHKEYSMQIRSANEKKNKSIEENEYKRIQLISNIEKTINEINNKHILDINLIKSEIKETEESYLNELKEIEDKIIELTNEHHESTGHILSEINDNLGKTNDEITLLTNNYNKKINDFTNEINEKINELNESKLKNNNFTHDLETKIINDFQIEIQNLDEKSAALRKKMHDLESSTKVQIEETKKKLGSEANSYMHILDHQISQLKKESKTREISSKIKELIRLKKTSSKKAKRTIIERIDDINKTFFNEKCVYIKEIEKTKSERQFIEIKKNTSIHNINNEKDYKNNLYNAEINYLNDLIELSKQKELYLEEIDINRLKHKNDLDEQALIEKKNELDYFFKRNEEMLKFNKLNLKALNSYKNDIYANNINLINEKNKLMIEHHKVIKMLQNVIFDSQKNAINKKASYETNSLRVNNIFFRDNIKQSNRINNIKNKHKINLIEIKIAYNNRLLDKKLDLVKSQYKNSESGIINLMSFKSNDAKIKYLTGYVEFEKRVINETYKFYNNSLNEIVSLINFLIEKFNNLEINDYIYNKSKIMVTFKEILRIISDLFYYATNVEKETLEHYIDIETDIKYSKIINTYLETKNIIDSTYSSRLNSLNDTENNYNYAIQEFEDSIDELINENEKIKSEYAKTKVGKLRISLIATRLDYQKKISEINSEIQRYKKLINNNNNNIKNINKSKINLISLRQLNEKTYEKKIEKVNRYKNYDLKSLRELLSSSDDSKTQVQRKINRFSNYLLENSHQTIDDLNEDIINFINDISNTINKNAQFRQNVFAKIKEKDKNKLFDYYEKNYYKEIIIIRKKSKEIRKSIEELPNVINKPFKEKETIENNNYNKIINKENLAIVLKTNENSTVFTNYQKNINTIDNETLVEIKSTNNNIDELNIEMQKELIKLEKDNQKSLKKLLSIHNKTKLFNTLTHKKFLISNQNSIDLLLENNKSVLKELKVEYSLKENKYLKKIKLIERKNEENKNEQIRLNNLYKSQYTTEQLNYKQNTENLIRSINDDKNKRIKKAISKFKTSIKK